MSLSRIAFLLTLLIGAVSAAENSTIPPTLQSAGGPPEAKSNPIRPGDLVDLAFSGAEPSAPTPSDNAKRAEELRREYGPELVQTHLQSRRHTESIHREWIATRVPLGDRWFLGLVGERAFFSLNEQDDPIHREADLTRTDLRLEWRQSSALRLWIDGELHEGTADGGGVGVGAALAARRWDLRLEGFTGRPWDDSTDAVNQDGERDGITLAGGWRPIPRLLLSGDVAAGWHRTGEEARIERFAGHRFEGGLRAEWTLLRLKDRFIGHAFLDRRAEEDETREAGLFPYISWRNDAFHSAPGFSTVPMIEDGDDRRLGLLWRQPWGRKIETEFDAYLGQDQERDIAWSDLYGGTARVAWKPAPRARLWAGFGLSSESSTPAGGRTATVEWGGNLDF